MGLLINRRQTDRKESALDFFNFVRLVARIYERINWFSFSTNFPQERGSCCYNQYAVYRYYGSRNGLSPRSYLDSAKDYSATGKQLNYIKATYDKHICANVITMVGFGRGQFKQLGVTQDAVYLLNPNDSGLVYFIAQHELYKLTFDWFKMFIMCDEHKWVCDRWPPVIEN
ncbi:uncharacterized protein LOC142348731 [Convolutriloba macropyga]|uniref:uncharacterized protein LOC142348731 n=1 Tax=Convolutriloba macropyga TaxID=536237 RepID=UPI003F525F05